MKTILLMATLVLSGCSALETMFAVAEDISTEVPVLLQPGVDYPAVEGPLTEEDSLRLLEDRGLLLEIINVEEAPDVLI